MIQKGTFPFNAGGIALLSVLVASVVGCLAFALYRRKRRNQNQLDGRRLDEIFQMSGSMRNGDNNPKSSAAAPTLPSMGSSDSGLAKNRRNSRGSKELPTSDDQIAKQWAANMRQSPNAKNNQISSRLPSTYEDTMLYSDGTLTGWAKPLNK
jgi:hypothetical protein